METEVKTDVIQYGNDGSKSAYGSIATRLLQAGGDIGSLRTLDTLRKDEWKIIDQVVLEERLKRIRLIKDYTDAGMIFDLRGVGLAKTVLQWETEDEANDAEISMDGLTRSVNQRPNYLFNNLLPLYITHASASFSSRDLLVSRNSKEPLDLASIRRATQKVIEGIEKSMVIGPVSDVRLPDPQTATQARAFGFTNFTSRNTFAIATPWTTATPTAILADVLSMKQLLLNKRFFGPYRLMVAPNVEKRFDDDYTTATSVVTTIRERLLRINNMQDIVVSDFLPDNNHVMLNMSSDASDLVVALDPTPIQWEESGGLRINITVMSVMVPRQKATQGGRSGIVHGS